MLELPVPEFYFPVSRNPFAFKTGLNKISFTQNTNKFKIFQIDADWNVYHQQKLKSRAEDLGKYIISYDFPSALNKSLCEFIIQTLLKQHSTIFSQKEKENLYCFKNEITNEEIYYDESFTLYSSNLNPSPPYESLLDALCCQIQEDISFISVKNNKDIINYLHLCFPNHWAAADKIGKSFLQAHAPVPAMQDISKGAIKLNQLLCTEGPFERFTWGLCTDTRLNKHPIPPDHYTGRIWHGREFSLEDELYIRIERQVTTPITQHDSFLFLIHTYFVDTKTLSNERLQRLAQSINTMPEEVLAYKGLKTNKNILLKKLHALV